MLLNRLTGGDWPGTLGVRRSILRATGGYDGRAMFENLELVRTVLAAGGTEAVPLDLHVARRPSTTRHFWSQRVRQAYDELARPRRMAAQLAVLPLAVVGVAAFGWPVLAAGARDDRRRGRSGPPTRGRCGLVSGQRVAAGPGVGSRTRGVQLARLGSRLLLGGVPYRGTILHHAATPMPVLRARLAPVRARLAEHAPPRRSA